jgi:16S rRNA (uracil1498-N3)-methyltransferase
MSLRRFLVAAPPERGRAVLDPETSKHAVKVLRLALGDSVVLFDGRGTEWPGTIAGTSKKGVRVDVGAARAAARTSGPRLVLATAIPKGKRMATLLAMATEAGVDAVIPVEFVRSAVRGAGPSKVEHWRRTVVEAARQSGRAWMPPLEEERPLETLLAAPRAAGERRIVATTDGAPAPLATVIASGDAARSIVLLVGPEGGFEPEESRAIAAAGFEPVSLGDHILRVETAGIVAVGILRAVVPSPAQE